MDNIYFRRIFTGLTLVILIILSFLVLKSIILYIILGFILAFIFSPVYNFLLKITKSPNFSATMISLLLILLIILPIWFFTPIIIDQVFGLYQSAQETNFVQILKDIFPSFFASEQFSNEVGSVIQSFITNLANSILNYLSKLILQFPMIMLNATVVLFTFFFALRDKDKIGAYLESLSPFPKETNKKLAHSSKSITYSILYGQVVLGFLQGVVISIGFFIFGVPSALFWSIIATLAGILPIVGPMIVWIPVLVYLVLAGDTFGAVGILVFGILSSNIDNLLRPVLVSRMTKMHSAIALVGMIGGLTIFGVLGLVIGPLALAYLTIVLEIYHGNKIEDSENKT